MDLIDAVRVGDLERVKLVIQKGADVNNCVYAYGWTPIFWAIERGQFDMCRFLLDHGADVNHKSHNGWTPLMFAVYNRRIDIVKLLVIRGANVNHKNNNGHPVLSYSLGRPKIIFILRWRVQSTVIINIQILIS
jgi:ankyrin repeat protein